MSNQNVEMQESLVLQNQRVGNSKFVVGSYVTGGSFGCLHLGHDNRSGQKVAIKVEKQDVNKPQLHLEFGFYRSLGVIKFVPRIYYFGPCREWSALVMELLGPSLFKMNQICGSYFSIVTTTKLAIQLLNIFEYVHEQGIIYRDIKPDNFLFGQPSTDKWCLVHLIDLGFCKRYIDDHGRHIEYVEGKCVTGTARYISINNHLGREISRRDDLEAILYMIIFLHKGELPWQGLNAKDLRQRTRQIGIIKMEINNKDLCSNMPEEFEQFLNTVKQLRFEERPRYAHFISLFRRVLHRLGVRFEDSNYDFDKSHTPRSDNQRL